MSAIELPTEPMLLPCCAWCKRIRHEGEYIALDQAEALGLLRWYDFTHGVCPECMQAQMAELRRAA